MPFVESKLKKKQSLLRNFPIFQGTRSFTLAEWRGSEPNPWKSPCTPHSSLLHRTNVAELEVEKEIREKDNRFDGKRSWRIKD